MTAAVLVIGAHGKMGQVTVTAIEKAHDLTLVATCGSQDNLEDLLIKHQPNIAVDFSLPQCVFENTQLLIKHNVHPVVGATGLTEDQLATLKKQSQGKKLGGIYAPNFSLSAALMIQFAKKAAHYLPKCEIIEMHHDQKIDKPSGTALYTQQQLPVDTPVHSIRLPGLFAHQSVMLGGEGETLTIRHDAIDRNCMMPGVLLACRQIQKYTKFLVGIERLINIK